MGFYRIVINLILKTKFTEHFPNWGEAECKGQFWLHWGTCIQYLSPWSQSLNMGNVRWGQGVNDPPPHALPLKTFLLVLSAKSEVMKCEVRAPPPPPSRGTFSAAHTIKHWHHPAHQHCKFVIYNLCPEQSEKLHKMFCDLMFKSQG